MSSTNKQAKVSGKRKHNELADQDENVNQHLHSSQDTSHLKKAAKRPQTTKHSEKRKRDESMDDEEVGDEVTKKHRHHHHSASKNQDLNDDDEEEEDYDDEEDLQDFIAQDDEEVEYEEGVGSSHDSAVRRGSEHERKRRKKKNREPRMLDEEDFDLIQENTGQEVKKKKRLQRVADQENKAPLVSDDEDQQPRAIMVKQDEDAQYFDNEVIDTSSRKRLITSANRRIPESYVDAESVQRHQKIFGDSTSIGAKVKQNQKAAAVLKDKSNIAIDESLEGVYDADELDDQFATKADLLIMKTDIPERLQIRIGDRLEAKMGTDAFKLELDHEVDYIFDNLEPLLKENSNYYQEDQVIKSKIKVILVYLRSQRYVYDVPMISKYRQYEYKVGNFLQEKHIQVIANLDVEYGKFRAQLQQVVDFFNKLIQVLHNNSSDSMESQIERDVVLTHLKELQKKCQSFSDLQTYQPIVQFFKQYYKSELEQEQLKETQQTGGAPLKALPRVRSSYDQIDSIKSNGLSSIARKYFISPLHFIENYTTQMPLHKPPSTYVEVEHNFMSMQDEHKRQSIIQTMIKFAAIELSVQPFIRKQLKQYIYQYGTLKTVPTEEGKKVLDPFHQSYRVKHIEGITLQSILNQAKSSGLTTTYGMDAQNRGDLFLDVLQNEKRQLITVDFDLKEGDRNSLINNFSNSYQSSEQGRFYSENILGTLKIMVNDILIPEISKEIRSELAEASENYVIKQCQEMYQDMLMVGPFQGTNLNNFHSLDQPSLTHQSSRGSSSRPTTAGGGLKTAQSSSDHQDTFSLPDRPRSVVMSAVMHQVDSQNHLVTVAIVDKYGEVLTFEHFSKLIPPREFKPKAQGGQGQEVVVTEEEEMRRKKMAMQSKEEMAEHQKDKDRIVELIKKYEVDLVVVGANKLEARLLKQTMEKVAENLSSAGANDTTSQLKKGGEGDNQVYDVFVSWGNLDVPKLFANSHTSSKLLKGYDQIVKQAVSLARYQQDPMNEVLNLWSFVIQENQALNLNLHPLQKMVNQAKLQEALEETNVACVCAVGVDINLLINHDHMHILLSFISGFGPRKAKHFIQNLKKNGGRILTRVEIYRNFFLEKACFISSIGFLKVRIAPEDLGPQQQIEPLSMTRIHTESYNIAIKVACDILHEDADPDIDMENNPDNLDSEMSKQRTIQQMKAINAVLKRPDLLQTLDIENYKKQLIFQGQGKMLQLIEMIVEEIKNPFKDPRAFRTKTQMPIPPSKLLLMLLEETDQTFKRGIIVTAQVIRVIEKQEASQSFVLCKLDNGLDAKIDASKMDLASKRLDEVVQSGQVITGRIDEIRDKEESKFGVSLTCRKVDLENHGSFLPEGIVCQPEDLINQAFKVDKEGGANGQRKFHMRRINHPKFKNINSHKAVDLLKGLEYGEFVFRPSSKGPDNITLTWKFYNNNIVHIDIQEFEKAIGASIGSKLQIGKEELFENLQEIVERYIAPCNKFMREAAGHVKFSNCSKLEEFEEILKAEKNQDPGRIPYRFTVLEEYPQHLVLGYVPKMSLVKEFIKIKPKGYNFHEQVHKQLQSLINWFKDNYRQRDYIRYQKKQLSPRARAPEAAKIQQQDEQEESKEWNNVQWNQPDKGGQSHYQDELGGGSSTDWQQVSRGNFSGAGRGSGGGPRSCFKCGETTHIAKDCSNPNQERRQYGSGSRGGRGGRDDSMRRGGNRDQDMSEPGGAWNNQPPSPKMEVPTWGATNSSGHHQESNNQWGAKNNEQPTAQGWGGSSHHGDVEMRSESRGWGNSDAGAGNTDAGGASGWGNQSNAGGFDTSNNNNQDDDQGRASRGRGRGARGGGFDNNSRGIAAGGDRTQSNKCFKCGEDGHFSRDCPNQQRAGGNAGGRGCFKCQQDGHMARDCPNPPANDSKGRGRGRGGSGSGGPITCYKCKQEGHMSRECPNESAGGNDQPYKRQRRDDDGGSSFRRPGGDDNPGNQWGDNSNNADSNQWGASAAANDSNANAWGANAEAQQTPNDGGAAAWGAPNNSNTGGGNGWN